MEHLKQFAFLVLCFFDVPFEFVGVDAVAVEKVFYERIHVFAFVGSTISRAKDNEYGRLDKVCSVVKVFVSLTHNLNQSPKTMSPENIFLFIALPVAIFGILVAILSTKRKRRELVEISFDEVEVFISKNRFFLWHGVVKSGEVYRKYSADEQRSITDEEIFKHCRVFLLYSINYMGVRGKPKVRAIFNRQNQKDDMYEEIAHEKRMRTGRDDAKIIVKKIKADIELPYYPVVIFGPINRCSDEAYSNMEGALERGERMVEDVAEEYGTNDPQYVTMFDQEKNNE